MINRPLESEVEDVTGVRRRATSRLWYRASQELKPAEPRGTDKFVLHTGGTDLTPKPEPVRFDPTLDFLVEHLPAAAPAISSTGKLTPEFDLTSGDRSARPVPATWANWRLLGSSAPTLLLISREANDSFDSPLNLGPGCEYRAQSITGDIVCLEIQGHQDGHRLGYCRVSDFRQFEFENEQASAAQRYTPDRTNSPSTSNLNARPSTNR
jgi:hypothetical protein